MWICPNNIALPRLCYSHNQAKSNHTTNKHKNNPPSFQKKRIQTQDPTDFHIILFSLNIIPTNMSRLLFALFILAIVCLKLCIENHDENTTEYPIYCPGVTDNRKNQHMLSDSAKYADNNMPTGYTPYANSPLDGNNNSKITVKNDTTAHTDAVVFVKHAGRIVRNTYIAAGDTIAIYVPNGTYTVLIYEGKGWHPTKQMPREYCGGFVSKECFYSYTPISLSYCTKDLDIGEACDKYLCSADDIFGSYR